MRQQIDLESLEQVSGGVVYLSKDWMKVGFSTMQETYDLKNCTFGQAYALADAVYEEHKAEGNAAVDAATKAAFQAQGWI